jgi:hypothetical protein
MECRRWLESGEPMTALTTLAAFLTVLTLAPLRGVGHAPEAHPCLESMPALAEADAREIDAFCRKVDEYVILHRRLEGAAPAHQIYTDAAKIMAERDALAGRIRAARAGARQGDIFGSGPPRIFRALVVRAMGATTTRELLELIHEEGGPPAFYRPHVGDALPEYCCFMPPQFLRLLPQLPEDIRYRFANRDLLLVDLHANMVVDVLPDALPPP